MNIKLTLTIDEDIIIKAKAFAKGENRSLSSIIENYLKSITKEEHIREKRHAPIVQTLKGSFKMPADFNYQEELRKSIEEKYL